MSTILNQQSPLLSSPSSTHATLRRLKRYIIAIFSSVTFLLVSPVHALNILLSNDDGFRGEGIAVLRDKLEAAGHQVNMIAPLMDQSGRGGALLADDNQEFIEVYWYEEQRALAIKGTPVMSVFAGLDYFYQTQQGRLPDLVISGINQGQNLGSMANHSGTVGAAIAGLERGVPAIAVSAGFDHTFKVNEATYQLAADLIVKVVGALDKGRKQGNPLMPQYSALNINVPAANAANDNQKIVYAPMSYKPVKFALTIAESETPLENGINLEMKYQLSDEPASENQSDEALFALGYTTLSILNGSLDNRATRADDVYNQALLLKRLRSVLTKVE